MGISYCTREDVKSALDFNETARNDAQVDGAARAAVDSVDSLTNRAFRPVQATRYFDWPSTQAGWSWSLWLDQSELISATSIVAGGVTIAPADYFLEPANFGPPYDEVQIDLASQASFAVGATFQRDVAITGLFGFSNVEEVVAATAEALDGSETGIDIDDSSAIGVGDVLRVDSERMTVVDKQLLDTAQDSMLALTASLANNTITVADGTQISQGEMLSVDAEKVLVQSVAGNVLNVRRAVDGSTLATHAMSTSLYAPRTLVVERASLGTTAATHLTSATLYRHIVPALVRELAVAESVNTLLQRSSGYSRSVGAGESRTDQPGAGIDGLRCQVYARYGRKARARRV